MAFFSSYIDFWVNRYESILKYTFEHIMISFTVIIISVLVTVPLAIFVSKLEGNKLKGLIFNIANIFQTIPTIALLAIMIPLLGIGTKPAVVALLLYSLLPLLRNTYAGMQSIDPSIIEAAKGMGYGTLGRLIKIELPMAFPYLMSGIRVTSVYIISWTTLGGLIGAGGLGDLILAGIGYNDTNMIVTGTLLGILIAVLLDVVLGGVERKFKIS